MVSMTPARRISVRKFGSEVAAGHDRAHARLDLLHPQKNVAAAEPRQTEIADDQPDLVGVRLKHLDRLDAVFRREHAVAVGFQHHYAEFAQHFLILHEHDGAGRVVRPARAFPSSPKAGSVALSSGR